ncbi:MAG: hypothetical protein K2Q22_06320 [Cytophagales bacterium]|nr:hypothetical protein [Cytophagales bacterium]
MKEKVKLTRKELAVLEEAALVQAKKDKRRIKTYIPDTWKKIESWGRETGNLSPYLQNYCFTISGRVRKNLDLEPLEVTNGIKILDLVAEKAPELIVIDEATAPKGRVLPKLDATLEVITQAVEWDRKNKILKSVSFTFMLELARGKKPLTEQNKKIATWNLEIIQKCGFEFKPSAQQRVEIPAVPVQEMAMV